MVEETVQKQSMTDGHEEMLVIRNMVAYLFSNQKQVVHNILRLTSKFSS